MCAYGDTSAAADCGWGAKDRPCSPVFDHRCVRACVAFTPASLGPPPVGRVKCGFRHIKLAVATMAQLRYTRNLFLRGICIIYLFAFLSFYVQIPGEAYPPSLSAPRGREEGPSTEPRFTSQILPSPARGCETALSLFANSHRTRGEYAVPRNER